MKNRILVLLLLLLVPPLALADFNDGVYAYLKGEYQQAYNTMRSLSESTNDDYTGLAQYYLAMMYLNGQGVEQDYGEAANWFRKAAERRIEQAQYKLGKLYMEGNGLPRDYEYAYAWYRVGAEHKHRKSIDALPKARGFLSETELVEADKLSVDLIRKYGPTEEDKNPDTAGSTNVR